MHPRTLAVGASFLLFCSVSASAQDTAGMAPTPGISLTLSGLFSVQPNTEQFEGGPYLEGSIGGNVAGVGASVSLPGSKLFDSPGPAIIALEINTTRAMSATLSGRLFGQVPTLVEHRDTLISFLPGVRSAIGKGALEFSGGGSLVLGHSSRDFAGSFISPALTGGVDAEIPISTRLGLVPTFRYSYVFRGDRNIYLGLGSHVMRFGFGVRIR
jgi:hypothetical protein